MPMIPLYWPVKPEIINVFVTNGFMTPEALESVAPYLDACNVDLKSFQEEFYQKVCHGRLQPVLDSIRHMKYLGIWVEVATLVVPGKNDDINELRDIARFIAKTDVDIPWHISRFHPDYRFTGAEATPSGRPGIGIILVERRPWRDPVPHCR